MTMQHRFKIEEVDVTLIQKLDGSHATAYFSAMTFQLGCAIGELVAMGVPIDQLLESIDLLVEKAVMTRLGPSVSVDTNPVD